MRELSLFTGVGGGILGSKLLGWKTVGYVEFNDYCQRIIKQRIADGIFDNAPIFGDITAFNSEGYADAYKGLVDIITGGFPCQPFSVAGKQLAENDARNMWPETIRTIRAIQPRFAFLENVPGIISCGYIGTVLKDIYESGYDAKWCVISGKDCNATIERKRIFILCWTSISNKIYSFKTKPNLFNKTINENKFWSVETFTSLLHEQKTQLPIITGDERVVDGLANRPQRFDAIGNGQIPICMATAFQILSEGIT